MPRTIFQLFRGKLTRKNEHGNNSNSSDNRSKSDKSNDKATPILISNEKRRQSPNNDAVSSLTKPTPVGSKSSAQSSKRNKHHPDRSKPVSSKAKFDESKSDDVLASKLKSSSKKDAVSSKSKSSGTNDAAALTSKSKSSGRNDAVSSKSKSGSRNNNIYSKAKSNNRNDAVVSKAKSSSRNYAVSSKSKPPQRNDAGSSILKSGSTKDSSTSKLNSGDRNDPIPSKSNKLAPSKWKYDSRNERNNHRDGRRRDDDGALSSSPSRITASSKEKEMENQHDTDLATNLAKRKGRLGIVHSESETSNRSTPGRREMLPERVEGNVRKTNSLAASNSSKPRGHEIHFQTDDHGRRVALKSNPFPISTTKSTGTDSSDNFNLNDGFVSEPSRDMNSKYNQKSLVGAEDSVTMDYDSTRKPDKKKAITPLETIDETERSYLFSDYW